MEWLIELDFQLFEWINTKSALPIFDILLPWVRNKYLWYPIYVFLFFFIRYSYSEKKSWLLIIGLVTVVAISDLLTGQLLKKSIKRSRPCVEMVEEKVNTRINCKQSFGFPSAHSANHFGIAAFLILGLSLSIGWSITVLLWAGLISYAQIYVGLHYPLDILAGAILGVLIARLCYFVLLGVNPKSKQINRDIENHRV